VHHNKYKENIPNTAVDIKETPDFSRPVKISFRKLVEGNPNFVRAKTKMILILN